MLTFKPIGDIPKYFDRVVSEFAGSERNGGGEESHTEEQSHTENAEGGSDSIELVLLITDLKFEGSYNIPPTSTGVIIFKHTDQDGKTKYLAEPLKFGLLPGWAKPRDSLPVKKKSGTGASYSREVQTHQSKLFNCRKETLAQDKTVWAGPRAHHRCVVPISGYFEWKTSSNGEKKPYYVHSNEPLLFLAGLYSHNRNYNDTDLVGNSMDYFSSFSIVTGPATGVGSNDMRWLHSRKPIFIKPFSKEWNIWLDNVKGWDETILECLNTDSNPVYDSLIWYAVQNGVGNPKNNSKDTIKEVKEKQLSITLFFSPKKSSTIKRDTIDESTKEKGLIGVIKTENKESESTGKRPTSEESDSVLDGAVSYPIAKRIKREHQGSESTLSSRDEEDEDDDFEDN